MRLMRGMRWGGRSRGRVRVCNHAAATRAWRLRPPIRVSYRRHLLIIVSNGPAFRSLPGIERTCKTLQLPKPNAINGEDRPPRRTRKLKGLRCVGQPANHRHGHRDFQTHKSRLLEIEVVKPLRFTGLHAARGEPHKPNNSDRSLIGNDDVTRTHLLDTFRRSCRTDPARPTPGISLLGRSGALKELAPIPSPA